MENIFSFIIDKVLGVLFHTTKSQEEVRKHSQKYHCGEAGKNIEPRVKEAYVRKMKRR